MKRFALVALLATAPAVAVAQSTADLLAQGIKSYEAFNVEQARPIFAQIISPSYLNKVSQDEKVTAYKYLGASYAILAKPDSARLYFVAALDFDPFTDLEVDKFSAMELGPFSLARNDIFRVGMKPIVPQVVNPRVDSTYYLLRIVTTQRASVTVSLIGQDNKTNEILFEGQNDGQKTIAWDGRRTSNGAVVDSGVYTLRIKATSMQGSKPEATENQLLKVEQYFKGLEDTLPALPDSLLLAEKLATFQPWYDLIKGTLVGASAVLLPTLILQTNTTVLDWKSHAFIGATVGMGSGLASWFYRSRNRKIDANITENERRRKQRESYNAAIIGRNNAKLADLVLIITPPGGR